MSITLYSSHFYVDFAYLGIVVLRGLVMLKMKYRNRIDAQWELKLKSTKIALLNQLSLIYIFK